MRVLELPHRSPPAVTWTEAAARLVLHEPLFDTHTSLAALRRSLPDRRPRSVFVGFGLCSRGELSQAVPLDVMGMLLPAELLRRRLGARELLVLIADTHALENGFPEAQVTERADALEQVLRRIRGACRLWNLRIIRASSLHVAGGYRHTLDRVRRRTAVDCHEYVRRQFADVLYLDETYGPLLKVGWALSSADPKRQRDERVLDQALTEATGAPLSFVYCKPARTLSEASPRMPPYVVKRPDARLCLDRPEDASAKLRRARHTASPETVAAFRSHLRSMLYTYCRVIEPLPRGTIEERLEALMARVGK